MLAQRLGIDPDHPRRYRPQECHRRPWPRPGGAARDRARWARRPIRRRRLCRSAATSANDLPAPSKRRCLARECLPAQDRHIDVGGIDLDREAGAAGHLGRDDGRARSAERLVDRPGPARSCSRSAGACTRPAFACRGRARRRRGQVMVHSVDCLRSPLQCAPDVPRTAYQQGSCCQ